MEKDVAEKDQLVEVLTPREIVSELDKYIIGQDRAKTFRSHRFEKQMEKTAGYSRTQG